MMHAKQLPSLFPTSPLISCPGHEETCDYGGWVGRPASLKEKKVAGDALLVASKRACFISSMIDFGGYGKIVRTSTAKFRAKKKV